MDSRRSAVALHRAADHAARSLDASSLRGRIVPELHDDSIREIFVSSYRMIYVVRPSRVLIIRFIHGARDLSADSTIYSQT